MKIYEKIENPIDNDGNLKSIIDAYLSAKEEGLSFYKKMVGCYAEDDRFNAGEFQKFKRIIGAATLERAKQDIKNQKNKKYRGKRIDRELIEEEQRRGRVLCRSSLGSPDPYVRYWYKKLLMQYERSLEENPIIKKYSTEEFLSIYDRIHGRGRETFTNSSKDERMAFLIMENCFEHKHIFDNLAGYHVYSKYLEKDKSTTEDRKYKIYLNISYNHLYRFAKKYIEICKIEGIPYTLKVLSPDTDNPDRTEKICIYAPIEEIFKVFDIVKAIIDANPGLLISNPPVTAGKFQGIIGFGCDPDDDEHSYNTLRAECICEALDEYFGDISVEEAKQIIRNNPQALQQIRASIKAVAGKYNIDNEKFCFSDGMEELFREAEDNYVSEPLKCDKSKLKIDGIKPTLLSMYTRLRAVHGKDSVFLKGFISKLINGCRISNLDYGTAKKQTKSIDGASHNDPDDACL